MTLDKLHSHTSAAVKEDTVFELTGRETAGVWGSPSGPCFTPSPPIRLPSIDDTELLYGDCISLSFFVDTRTRIGTVGGVMGVANMFSLLLEELAVGLSETDLMESIDSRLAYSVIPPSMSLALMVRGVGSCEGVGV